MCFICKFWIKERIIKSGSIFFFMLLIFPIIGHGQAVFKCFNLEKIKKIYASTFMEINSMLFHENWEIVSNTNQIAFVLGKDTLIYDNFSQWKFELSVDKWLVSQYRKKGLDPVLVIQTSKNCYETIESDLKKNNAIVQKTLEDSIQHLQIFHIQQGMDIIFSLHNNRKLYLITVCNYAQIDSLIQLQITEKKEYEITLREQQKHIQMAINQVDSLRNVEDYAAAIFISEQTISLPFFERGELVEEAQEMINKMEIVKKEFQIKTFNTHLQLADTAFAKEHYAVAKEHLLQAQEIDPDSHIVIQKMKEIEKIESMFIIRKDSIFNYQFYHKSICDSNQISIFNKLRNYFLNFDEGDVDFTCTLSTDTLGKNSSSYQINMFSLRPTSKASFPIDTEDTWALFLDTLTQIRPVPPVKIDYLYVNAATTFPHHSSWQSSNIKVFNRKKIKFSPQIIPDSEKRILENYFTNNGSLPNGNYTIEKKDITYQDSLYKTFVLKKLYTVGPEAMLFSMLCPGAGSLAATQGKKGWGTLSTSILFLGVGITGITLSESWAKKGTYDTKVTNAVKYASYGSFAVSGVIYFSDIFVALKRGIKNLEKSRALKAKLKEPPLYIQDFPQQIEP